MSATKLQCPSCASILTAATTPRPGKRTHCPKCGKSFRYGKKPKKADPNSSAQESLLEETNNRGLLLALLFGGLILLGGASIVLVMVFANLGAQPRRAEGTENAPDSVATPNDNGAATPQIVRSALPEPDLVTPPPLPTTNNAVVAPAPLNSLSPAEQERVTSAVAKGVAYLRSLHDSRLGKWPITGDHSVGVQALPLLALLESGVEKDDPLVKETVAFIRKEAATTYQTYDLALGILLFDRLGDPADEDRIRSFAAKLIAGQTAGGGWTYECPKLNDLKSRELLLALETTRPPTTRELSLVESSMSSKNQLGKAEREPETAKPLSDAEFTKALVKLPEDLKHVQALSGSEGADRQIHAGRDRLSV